MSWASPTTVRVHQRRDEGAGAGAVACVGAEEVLVMTETIYGTCEFRNLDVSEIESS